MSNSKKQLALLSLLYLTGTIYAQQKSIIHPMKQRLYAKVQAQDTSQCQSFITTNKKYIYDNQGSNYSTYISQSGWEDSDFAHGDTCYAWSLYTDSGLPSSQYSAYTWQRAMSTSSLSNQAIFYQNTEYNDMAQGGLGDCYFIAAISSVAEQPLRLRQAILTDDINTGGIFAMEIYTRGIPYVMYIDDYVPFSGSSPAFAAQSNDGSIYAMLLEKMWAKVNGNYEQIIGGSSDEMFDFIAGVPSVSFSLSSSSITANQDLVSTYIDDAVANKYVIAGGTPSCGSSGDSDRNAIGMACGHAYSILGTATLDGVKLIKVRNPWSTDTYTGAYSDSNLTDAQAASIGTTRNLLDGVFFISQSEFVTYLSSFYIGYFVNDDYNNYLDVVDSVSGTKYTYTFTVPSSGTYSVGVQYYDTRMFPYGCKTTATTGIMKLKDPSGTSLTYKYVYDWNLMNAYRGTLSAGTYTIQMTPTWQDVDVKEYTVRVVGPAAITISGGTKTSQSRQLLHIDDSTASQTWTTSNDNWSLPPASSTVTLDSCGNALVTDLATQTAKYTTWASTVYSSSFGGNVWTKNSAWVTSPSACSSASYYSYYYSVGKITGGATKAYFYFTTGSSTSEIVSNTGYACEYVSSQWKCYCDLTSLSSCNFETTTPNSSISSSYTILL